jgi:hypothetical protein
MRWDFVHLEISGFLPDNSAFAILQVDRPQIGGRSMNDKPKPAIEMVTLKQLCAELKVEPREARERLRLAVRDARKNPELAKLHKPGNAWEWPKNSVALKEAKNALTSGC